MNEERRLFRRDRDDLLYLIKLLNFKSLRNLNLSQLISFKRGARVKREIVIGLRAGRFWSVPGTNFAARLIVHSVVPLRATIQIHDGKHTVMFRSEGFKPDSPGPYKHEHGMCSSPFEEHQSTTTPSRNPMIQKTIPVRAPRSQQHAPP